MAVGRQHHPGGVLKRARNEFAIEKAAGIEGAGKRQETGWKLAEADPGVIGLVAHQNHEAVAQRPRPVKSFAHQGQPDPEVLPLRMNRERSEQQGRRSPLADAQRPEADGTGKPKLGVAHQHGEAGNGRTSLAQAI